MNFDLFVLDVTDVIVSKLKRFNSNDIDDAAAMIRNGAIAHQRLVERFQSAFDEFAGDARAADLPRYIENLNRLERDLMGVAETEIDTSSLRY